MNLIQLNNNVSDLVCDLRNARLALARIDEDLDALLANKPGARWGCGQDLLAQANAWESVIKAKQAELNRAEAELDAAQAQLTYEDGLRAEWDTDDWMVIPTSFLGSRLA